MLKTVQPYDMKNKLNSKYISWRQVCSFAKSILSIVLVENNTKLRKSDVPSLGL